jgi:4-carboxymuconolactone decarboxylase
MSSQGERVARSVHGSRWDRIAHMLSEIDPELARYVTEWAYGEVYARTDLDLRTREIIAITCLSLEGPEPQLQTHILSALDAGISEQELMGVFLHIIPFAGFPRALRAMQVAREILNQRDTSQPHQSETDPRPEEHDGL